MKRKMLCRGLITGFAVIGTVAWTITARAGYESDGDIEIRENPDLMLAATNSKMDTRGHDGNFIRLFRLISGNNDSDQKIAMTTPVFMQAKTACRTFQWAS
ncbi:heme-binding protein [Rhodopirellula europaea]|uniref:Secreted SOUL heme-binding protein n=1 Tax=Rhodopirellula europaea 6C TaxID=1263867 RepID=M2AHF1_9BACT|nr:heme-binding protein [Rhodopirellula europaea]EMB16540.1 secreted SOUL heme-binding protein [Rhodopirellula europaea 6C]